MMSWNPGHSGAVRWSLSLPNTQPPTPCSLSTRSKSCSSMAGGMEDRHAASEYSPLTGLVYIFNLIVGTGALTLPAAFHDAGWGLSSAIIVMLAFMSYLTATFMIEAMAAANAMVHWKRIQRLKKSGGVVSDELVARTLQTMAQNASFPDPNGFTRSTDNLLVNDTLVSAMPSSSTSAPHSRRSDREEDAGENEPLIDRDMIERIPQAVSSYYNITEVIEMGKMASIFFNKTGRTLFYICITIYLYGDLAIYGAAVAKSLRDVACTFRPANATSPFNISEAEPCFEGVVGPFAFCNVQKTKYLQILTTIMRWLAFGCMVSLACLRLAGGIVANPPVTNVAGIPNLFGVCVYSFMCHHSLPSLVTPISQKKHIFQLLLSDYVIILGFYVLLAFTGIFAFAEINDLYTLNFQPKPGEPWFLASIHYFLSLFPVFTLSTNFPIIAITLRNNLKALFLTEGRMYSWCTRSCVFPCLALIPPFAVALATNSLEFLVGVTGSYAGAGIQYVVPAFLVYMSRKQTQKAIGIGVINQHRSVFKSPFWVFFVNLWAIGCVILVTWNHLSSFIH
eukprot:TCALIF_12412-PA protein Name:"Similar to TMEM104 Transmembrane protein 104 (Gallus gallus)" AED:0.11 eAED:0.11 QI:0/0.75/0.66/0.88/0.75/0.66/9/182/563